MQTQNSSFDNVHPILLVLNGVAILALMLMIGSAIIGKTSTLLTWMRAPQPRTVARNEFAPSNDGANLASLRNICLFEAVCLSVEP